MTPQTHVDLVAGLKNSRETLWEPLAGIAADEARKNPAPDRRSALACVEPLTIAEEREFLLTAVLASRLLMVDRPIRHAAQIREIREQIESHG